MLKLAERHALAAYAAVAVLTALSAPTAHAAAAFTDISLAGWVAVDDFGVDGNTERLINIGAGSLVTGFSYSNLRFTTDANLDSYLSEFVLSVNNASDVSRFLDWAPSTTNTSGTFGPASGSWGGTSGQAGPYGAGAPFSVADGSLYITSYLSYFLTPSGVTVSSGSLRIFYNTAAVPEPASYALMAAGLFGVGAAARRRKTA